MGRRSRLRGVTPSGRSLHRSAVTVGNGCPSRRRPSVYPGETITLPAECRKSVVAEPATATPVNAKAQAEVKAKKGVRQWRHMGVDPVVSKQWHLGDKDGRLSMTPEQRQRLRDLGFSAPEADAVGRDLLAGRCTITLREKDHVWGGGMGFGSGYWKEPTQNATGEAVEAWACPSVGDKQVDFPKCGNPAINPTTPKAPVPQSIAKVDEETGLSCEKIATAWAPGELTGQFINASVRMGCLFDIGPNSKLGPVVGAQIGRYWGKDGWNEKKLVCGVGSGISDQFCGLP